MQLARLFPQSVQAANSNIAAPPLFSLRVVSKDGETIQPRVAPWRESLFKSAALDPQGCGFPTSKLFDLAGLIAWLRSRFPSSTGYHVEAMTGISAATVENWVERRSSPSAENLSILLSVFGPSLMRAALRQPAAWIERACEAERLIEIEAEMANLAAERAKLRP